MSRPLPRSTPKSGPAPEGRLSKWMRSPVFRTLVVVGGIGVVCKLAALGRELLIAAHFGASESLDAFLVAVILPVTLANVIGNVLATSLLPQLRTRGTRMPCVPKIPMNQPRG